MDGRITDDYYWKPDQVQIFNPILILLLVPVFEGAVFPLLDKYRVPFKPLARMTAGMVLAGIAFVLAGLIQLRIDVSIIIVVDMIRHNHCKIFRQRLVRIHLQTLRKCTFLTPLHALSRYTEWQIVAYHWSISSRLMVYVSKKTLFYYSPF